MLEQQPQRPFVLAVEASTSNIFRNENQIQLNGTQPQIAEFALQFLPLC